MATIYGTVASTYKKSLTSKAGKPFEILFAKVEQKSGEVVDIELGFPSKAPKNIHAGNFYQFETKFNYGKHQYQSHTQSSTADAPAASVAPAAGGAGPKYYEKNAGFLTKTFPVPIDHPDRSIIRQNAMGHAINIAKEIGILDGVRAGDAHTAEAFDDIREIAMMVEDFATGDYEYRMLAEKMKEDKGD